MTAAQASRCEKSGGGAFLVHESLGGGEPRALLLSLGVVFVGCHVRRRRAGIVAASVSWVSSSASPCPIIVYLLLLLLPAPLASVVVSRAGPIPPAGPPPVVASVPPFLIATVTDLTGNQRIGISPLIAMFLLALVLLGWVKPEGEAKQ